MSTKTKISIKIKERRQLKLVSYNILFDEIDRNGLSYLTRLQLILLEINHLKPDIICIQEVIKSRDTIKLFDQIGYRSLISKTDRMYRELIAYRPDFKLESAKVFEFTNSIMERELLVAKFTHPEFGILHIGTSHLESMYPYKTERLSQLNYVFKTMNSLENAFFLADTNLHIDQALRIPKGWSDAFNAAGQPTSEKYTYDSSCNSQIQTRSKRATRKRFDRIFYNNDKQRVRNFKLIRNEYSDHF